jgi:predicted DNA binding CopG/RHH family protein
VKVRNKVAKLPKFKDELEESAFWDTHDSTDYLDDTEEAKIKFIDARPKTLISLRLQTELIDELKVLAAKRGIGYQTLIRMWVMERLEEETLTQSFFLTQTTSTMRIIDYARSAVNSPSTQEAVRRWAVVGDNFVRRFANSIAVTEPLVKQAVDSWQRSAIRKPEFL